MAMLVNNTCLMILAIIGVFMLFAVNNVVGQCPGDIQHLVTQCAPYILKSRPKSVPSRKCCDVVKNINFSCVCQNLTKKILHLLDIQKVVYVAQFCGNPIPPGTECGGVPMP